MKITILCDSKSHPINPYLIQWVSKHSALHKVELVRRKSEAKAGDLLLLVSCTEILTQQDRAAYAKTLVIHASDLPRGRGWSPHIWQILEGQIEIVVTLLEAEDKVDSGDIWHQLSCHVPRHALWDEINRRIFDAELQLMDFAVNNFDKVVPRPQSQEVSPTYYPKRTEGQSELDIRRTLEEQFDSIRVADPDRFPSFFKMHGHIYKIRVEKISND